MGPLICDNQRAASLVDSNHGMKSCEWFRRHLPQRNRRSCTMRTNQAQSQEAKVIKYQRCDDLKQRYEALVREPAPKNVPEEKPTSKREFWKWSPYH